MKRNNKYYKNLIEKVVKLSVSNKWEDAVLEWEILKCEEDEESSSTCVCGKDNIKYLFTIVNIKNGNELFPIGSTCIKRFGRQDLEEEYVSMLKILNKKDKNPINTNQNKKTKDIVFNPTKTKPFIKSFIIQKSKYRKWYKGAGRW